MDYIIVDLEATCWENEKQKDRMEIIEIGAVRLTHNLEIADEFASFVRPICSPILSPFCMKLTSIRQADVDEADTFAGVFPRFLKWIGKPAYYLCSWGHYDFNQFQLDCKRHQITCPFSSQYHKNLKQIFADTYHTRPLGMAGALQFLKWPLQGTHHRGIDDARNIAKIAQFMFKNQPADKKAAAQ